MKNCTATPLCVHFFIVAAVVTASAAYGQSGTWLGNGLPWNNTAAWVSGTIATGSANTANFTGVNLTSDVSMALGADRTIGNITFTDAGTSSHDLTLSGNTLTLAGTPAINVTQPGRNLALSSILAGTAGFSKTGQGTLTLTGSNTITGATSISGGGTLVLDYSTNDARKLPNNSTLTLGGGTIGLRGGTASENFTSIALSGSAGTFFVRDGGTSKINLNTLGAGGLSAVSFSHDSMATTDRLNSGGILGGWYTVGNRFAANATNAANGDIVGYTSATAFTGANGSTTGNFDLSGSLTLSSAQSFNTLRIVNTADNQTLALGAANRIFINNSQFGGSQPEGGGGALMYAGGANGNYTISGSMADGIRWVTQNGQGGLINIFSGTLTVGVGIGSGSTSISKTGEGTLVLAGGNVSSGDFRIYQGVVRLRISSFGTVTNTGIVQNGAALELANTINVGKLLNITGPGVANGGALRNFANSNTYSGAITIGTGGARINSDIGTLTLTGGITTAGNTVTFGGVGNTTVSTAAISGSGGLFKDGAGVTTLAATNSYTGATTVNAGTLFVNGSLAAGSAVSVGASGTLGGIGAINGVATIFGGHTPGNSPGIQTFASNLTYSGGSSTVQWELVGNTNTNAANPNAVYDQVLVGGSLDFAGATSLSLLFNGAGSSVLWANSFWDSDQQWTLYAVTGSTTNFGNLSLTAGSYLDSASNTLLSARPNASFNVAQSGTDVVISYVAVPEPTSIAVLGAGAALLGLRIARRRKV